MTSEQRRGQEIYRNGTSSLGTIINARLQDEVTVTARNFPCANCHGLEGEGGKEGGLNVPGVRWKILTAPRTLEPSLRARPTYSEIFIYRAISAGIDSAGVTLHSGMPRYQMSDEQLGDLVSYLKILGTNVDVDPGVSEGAIRIGSVLPLTGPLATIGLNVQTVLRAYFDRVNNAGGIYGRKFELLIVDSHGEAKKSIAATRRLIEHDHVFALIASYEPSGASVDKILENTQVPLIAPVSFAARSESMFNRYTFNLLPSFADQARCLVDFAYAQENIVHKLDQGVEMESVGSTVPRYALMHGDGVFDLDAKLGFNVRKNILGLKTVPEFSYESGSFSVDGAIEFLTRNQPSHVFFFGAAEGLKATMISAADNNLNIHFFTTSAMADSIAFELARDTAERLWLAQTLLVSEQALFSLDKLLKNSNNKTINPAFGVVAYAAAEVFTEAIKRASRKLSRARLIHGLETFIEFNTDVMPPITFSHNRRFGTNGCAIIRGDPKIKRYEVVSPNPKNNFDTGGNRVGF